MDAPREYFSDDTRLGIGLNDLGSILALPAVWAGAEPSQIVSTLVDTLLEILHLSFAFVRLSALDGTPSIEIVRIADSLAGADRAREIRDAIDASLGDGSPKPLSRSTTPVGEVDLSVASARLGLDGEIGIIVAGSHRPDFPAQTERLFLDIAANQATIGLQQAYLAEQRRVAEVLHERVAQHTRELAIANEALRESEHTSRLLVHTIPGLVAILTPAGEVDVVNHELVEYCGQPLEAMKQWGTNGTIHPDDLPRVVQVFTQAISSGDSYDFEARIRRFDGVYHWCQVRGLPFRDPSGRILRWYVLLSDIDDRKRAENALRESERESRLIVDSIPGFIAAFTPDGELEFVNRPIFEYFGKTLGELKHWGSGGMVHPEDLPRVVEVFTQSIASGDTFESELRGRRFDGVYRWFQSRGLPLRDTSEHIVRWYNLLIDIDDRKRAEEALRESERKFRLLVETIPAFVWRGTSEGELDYLNERAVEYLGRTVQSLAGGGWIELVHPGHRDATVRRWLHSSTTGSSYDDIYKIRRADGQYRWIQSIGEPFYDAEGQIAHWYGVIIDIDDRKRAEQELRLSEARKAAILDSAIDCIVTIDHEGCITEFNPAAERTFGYRRDEVVGQQLADIIIPPALRERHRQGFARYLATGEARVLGRRIEMTAVRADGSEFPTELAITRIPSDGPPSFTGYLRDITERKQSEEELRRSAAFLAEAQQLSRVGSFSWEVATDDIVWSEQLYRIFEIDRGVPVTFEVIGTRVHPEDLSTFKEQIERSRQDGSEVQLEIRLQMPDRTIKYVHVVAHCRSHGNQLEYIGAVQDVTQRRLSEEALAKVRSELAHVARATSLGVLTASIAHEVNQPLAGIITNAGTCLRMLGADPPDVDGARETARRTIRDGNRASDVMTRLRALFSKREFSLESVDLNEATQEVLALSLSDLQRHRVILQSELADDLPTVTGDRIQLQQVILNLVRNASEAMVEVHKRPRLLLIKTEREDVNRVRLTVRDSGIGLPPESLDSLFDAFHTTKSGGMGIGLFVSRSIVERHQGRLWAEPNDGRPGATFSFSIPFQRG